ncbi:MAG: HNH endonuclease [Colwellia sp.]|nr:HNH endonuclease [Colwellia sp.]
MSKYLDEFNEDIIIKVLRAYLINSESHRTIQRNILGLPAPAKGGGFVAMEILHHYGIKGEHKGLLQNEVNLDDYSDLFRLAIYKVKEFNEVELLAKEAIKSNNHKIFEQKAITEIDRTTKQRIGQSVLRSIVLENYSGICAFCDIHQSDLLVCSHIVPWTMDSENRLNPTNAILLCRHHDGLFDKGYFGLDSDYNIVLSKKSDPVISNLLKNNKFKAPMSDQPNFDFLMRHRVDVCGL